MSRRRNDFPAELRDRDRSPMRPGPLDAGMGPGSIVKVTDPVVLPAAHPRARVQLLVGAMFTYGVATGLFLADALMWAAVTLWLLATGLMLCLSVRLGRRAEAPASFGRSTGHNSNDGARR